MAERGEEEYGRGWADKVGLEGGGINNRVREVEDVQLWVWVGLVGLHEKNFLQKYKKYMIPYIVYLIQTAGKGLFSP